ncbi:MAG: hypothetical protein HY608_10170, partial [Planctomycetes bacterium]|nr:hypothetical protein [Planctomycetota bacterium]
MRRTGVAAGILAILSGLPQARAQDEAQPTPSGLRLEARVTPAELRAGEPVRLVATFVNEESERVRIVLPAPWAPIQRDWNRNAWLSQHAYLHWTLTTPDGTHLAFEPRLEPRSDEPVEIDFILEPGEKRELACEARPRGAIGTPARAHGTYSVRCTYGHTVACEHNPEGRWTGGLTSEQANFTIAAMRAAPPSGAAGDASRHIERLASDSFEEREAATAALRALGEGARGALEGAVKHADPEVCARAQGLLHGIDRPFEFPPGFTLEISRNVSSGKPNPTWTVSDPADLREIFWRLRGLPEIPRGGGGGG